MEKSVTIIHRRKPAVFQSGEYPLWSTCLRSLAFAQAEHIAVEAGDQVYTHQEAYGFLLEIVCGLHSPIAGETEVFGQFKAFAQEWAKLEPMRAGLIQSLLNDAKAIRTEHLSNLGTQSYGGWLRKKLTCGRVHVIGGGVLAREILPYVSKQGREAIVHVRDPRKVDFFTGDVRSLAQNAYDGGAVVIAAPLTAAQVREWLGGREPEQIFDLREDSHTDRVSDGPAFLLQDVFTQIESTKSRLGPKLELVRREILARAIKATERSLLRPQGWDDLCA